MKESIKNNVNDFKSDTVDPKQSVRLSLSIKSYNELFPFRSVIPENSVREKAFNKAWEIRNFEINLYWKRATYFWTFIASTFAGYIAVISSDNYYHKDMKAFEFYIICLGIVLSTAWVLANNASKRWQSNWEGHIDRLELDFTGPLYKTVSNVKSFSVSSINEIVSYIILCVWILLLTSYLMHNSDFFHNAHNKDVHVLGGLLILGLAFILFGLKGRSGVHDKNLDYIIRKSK